MWTTFCEMQLALSTAEDHAEAKMPRLEARSQVRDYYGEYVRILQ
jgi:hypothetical protein